MVTAEIIAIDLSELAPEDFLDGYIDAPVPGSQVDAHSIILSGWILTRRSGVVLVRVACDGIELATTKVELARPDVAGYHRLTPNVEKCGYSTHINLLGVGTEFELTVHIVLEDGRNVLWARV